MDKAGIDLPDYIVERNAQAMAAGLTIEKQTAPRAGMLTTWYRGTEAQWCASPFCRRGRPFPRQSSYKDFRCFHSGEHHIRIDVTRRGDLGDDYRGSIANELLPEWIDSLGAGVTVYGYQGRRGLKVSYLGRLKNLVAHNVVPADVEQSEDGFGLRAGKFVYLLTDGRVLYHDEIGEREAQARDEAERAKPDFKNGAEVVAKWHKNAWIFLRMLSDEFGGNIVTKQGLVFTLTRDSKDAIQSLTDELLEAIESAQVTVKDPRGSATPTVRAARDDVAFRSFLRTTGVPSQSTDRR